MIKKITDKDKKDWLDFTRNEEKLFNKDIEIKKRKQTLFSKSIDLHGYSLSEANKVVKNFIILCYEKNIYKVTVITGKGSRSKNKIDPYKSENLSILKYSVPEYINSTPELLKIIKSINSSDIKSPSIGSFDIYLKKK